MKIINGVQTKSLSPSREIKSLASAPKPSIGTSGLTNEPVAAYISTCAIVSLVDLDAKHRRIALFPSKRADVVSAAIVNELRDLQGKPHTLTADNGKEFSRHARIATRLGAEICRSLCERSKRRDF